MMRDGAQLAPGGALLELEGVVKRFRAGGEEVRAVDGVSLRVRAG